MNLREVKLRKPSPLPYDPFESYFMVFDFYLRVACERKASEVQHY
jgi:hypothetical protein